MSHSKVDVLVFSLLQLQFERNTFTFNLDDHLIEAIVDIKYDVFTVFLQISRSEYNRDFQHILLDSLSSSLLVLNGSDFNR